jgi:hypothetical protein
VTAQANRGPIRGASLKRILEYGHLERRRKGGCSDGDPVKNGRTFSPRCGCASASSAYIVVCTTSRYIRYVRAHPKLESTAQPLPPSRGGKEQRPVILVPKYCSCWEQTGRIQSPYCPILFPTPTYHKHHLPDHHIVGQYHN